MKLFTDIKYRKKEAKRYLKEAKTDSEKRFWKIELKNLKKVKIVGNKTISNKHF